MIDLLKNPLDREERLVHVRRYLRALGACRTWGVESEKRPRRGQFLSISPGNSRTIAQKIGRKWTDAAVSQPTILKSDRLLGLVRYRALLFGSLARGDFTAESDTGLLVISDEFPQSPKARMDLLYSMTHLAPEVEPIGWQEAD